MCLHSYTILCFHIFSPFSRAPQFKENLQIMKIKSKNLKCPFKKNLKHNKMTIFATSIRHCKLWLVAHLFHMSPQFFLYHSQSTTWIVISCISFSHELTIFSILLTIYHINCGLFGDLRIFAINLFSFISWLKK